MSVPERPPTYIAFVLRCWLEGSTWRYSLEEIGANNRRAFATLDELFSFLLAKLLPPSDVESLPSAQDNPLAPKYKAGTMTEDPSRFDQ